MSLKTRLQNRSLATSIAKLLPALAFAVALPSASAGTVYWEGVAGNWSDTNAWSSVSNATTAGPVAVPVSGDIATFNITTATGGVQVLLNGNQAADKVVFNHTSGTAAIRSTAANQVLSIGTGGVTFGTAQVDLGGNGVNTMVVQLMGNQAWTSAGSGLIQLNFGVTPSTQTITNGTAGLVTLTFDGLSTGSKTVVGAIDNGILGGTTALILNTTGTFGNLNLNGANLYSGGTTLTQGFLSLGNNAALGVGALTFGNTALTKVVSSGLAGGVTMTNNNALNLNGTITLGGTQNINFGTGATALQSATTLLFNGNTNPVIFTLGGAITGANNLTVGATGTNTNSMLVLNGANTGNSTANPLTILGQTVRFGSGALPTGAGSVVLNGGSLAVGTGLAYPTVSSAIADATVTKTAGAFALTGDSSENITLAASSASLSLGAALGSVAKYTGALTPSGTAYNVGGGGGTIVFSSANTFTGTRSFGTNGSNFNTFGGGGTVVINGVNNFVGAVGIGVGTLEVTSIGSVGGGSSALGAPTTAANGTISFGMTGGSSPAFLRYTGTGETTNRVLSFNSFSGSRAGLDASGTGAVNFAGTFTSNSNSTNRFIDLRGINTGANTIAGSIGITGQPVGGGGPNLTKSHRGNWTLTGTNNFAGTNAATAGLVINGGTLTGDYSSGAVSVLGNTATNLTLGGGTLAMVNNTAATVATQGIGNSATPNVILTANTGQSNINVTGNGTAGSAVLTLGNTLTRNTSTFLNFNLLSGGQVTSSPTLLNGVVVGTSTVAAFTVTDSTGTDFATVTGGQIGKLGAATPLETTGGANANNRVLTAGQTQSGPVAFNTLRISPTASGNTLDLGANGFTTSSVLSILKDSAFDFTITGSASVAAANTAVVLSNFGTGAMTLGVNLVSGTGSLAKTGSGLVDLAVPQTYTGGTSVFGGVLRVSNTIGTGNITLNTGGIYEIGTAATFTRQVGSGASQVQWGNGDGGFSAFGGSRTVNLTNALGIAGGPLVWGSTSGNNNVVTPSASPLFVRDGFALLLSSATAAGTLTFQNAIDLVNMPRAVVVGNGSSTVDAVLSGVLSSSDYSGGIDKSGPGTLAVTGTNTFTGTTRVLEGTLQIGNAGTTGTLSGTSGILILSGANLAFNRTNALAQSTDLNSNAITGAGSVTQSGTGTTTLSLTNTYTGGTTSTAGVLLATVTAALPGYNTPGSVVFNGGTVAAQIGGWTTGDVDTLLANGTKIAGALGIDTTNGSLTQWTPFTTTNFGPALGLTKLGANTLTLDQANDYEGATTVLTGILAISNNTSLGTATGNTIINVTGSTLTHGRLSLSNNITVADNIVLQGSGLGGNEGNITATGGVNHLTGTVTLTGNNGYRLDAGGAGTVINYDGQILDTSAGQTQLYVSGATSNFNASINTNGGAFFAHGGVSINATGNNIGNVSVQYNGLLKLGISDALPPTKNLIIGLPASQLANGGDVGTLDLQGTSQTVNALNGFASTGTAAPNTSRKITNSVAATTSALIVGNGNASGTFDGVIENGAGTVTVEKVGAGTETFSGPQNYSQLTTTGGIMNVDGSFTSGLATVNANAGTTNFGASQTLLALIIGDGAVVTLGAPPHAPAFTEDSFGTLTVSTQAVPEPGIATSVLTGLSLLLGLRRRRS